MSAANHPSAKSAAQQAAVRFGFTFCFSSTRRCRLSRAGRGERPGVRKDDRTKDNPREPKQLPDHEHLWEGVWSRLVYLRQPPRSIGQVPRYGPRPRAWHETSSSRTDDTPSDEVGTIGWPGASIQFADVSEPACLAVRLFLKAAGSVGVVYPPAAAVFIGNHEQNWSKRQCAENLSEAWRRRSPSWCWDPRCPLSDRAWRQCPRPDRLRPPVPRPRDGSR